MVWYSVKHGDNSALGTKIRIYKRIHTAEFYVYSNVMNKEQEIIISQEIRKFCYLRRKEVYITTDAQCTGGTAIRNNVVTRSEEHRERCKEN